MLGPWGWSRFTVVTEYREDGKQREHRDWRAELRTQRSVEKTDGQSSMVFSICVNCPAVGGRRAGSGINWPEMSLKKEPFWKAWWCLGLAYSDYRSLDWDSQVVSTQARRVTHMICVLNQSLYKLMHLEKELRELGLEEGRLAWKAVCVKEKWFWSEAILAEL